MNIFISRLLKMHAVQMLIFCISGGLSDHGMRLRVHHILEHWSLCVCDLCISIDMLSQASVRLLASGKYDMLLIESTGISEPMPIAATFTAQDDGGFTLSGHFTIDNMVSTW